MIQSRGQNILETVSDLCIVGFNKSHWVLSKIKLEFFTQ